MSSFDLERGFLLNAKKVSTWQFESGIQHAYSYHLRNTGRPACWAVMGLSARQAGRAAGLSTAMSYRPPMKWTTSTRPYRDLQAEVERLANVARAVEADLCAASADAAKAAMVAGVSGFMDQPAADDASRAGMVPADLVSLANEEANSRKRRAKELLPLPHDQMKASSSAQPAATPLVTGAQTIPDADSHANTDTTTAGSHFH
ncbi:unnamed protein product [Heligmosomoides polygyrus]|uniref:DNA-binding protein n=1 Tax=Heligmosomoides polygyrus TaxID=6339 RepID=A0A183FQE8_HELPZ|nr:unnamed protein product [Heligmosomoides polygyrus]